MQLEQALLDFYSRNLYSGRAKYYINFFSSMSENDFEHRIKKYCYEDPDYTLKNRLGTLDVNSTMLLITSRIIHGYIERSRLGPFEDKSNVSDAYRTADEDLHTVTDELFRRIKESNREALQDMINENTVLPHRADFAHGFKGYDFYFRGQEVYVYNWYPMGGD